MDQEQKNYDDSYNLRKIFEEIELDLVKNLVRNMKRHEIEEQKEGFRWEMWQAAKLRNLRQYKKQNQEILGKRQEDIRVLIEQAIKGGYAKGKDIFDKIAARMFRKKRVKFPKGIKAKKLDKPAKPELDFFGMNDKKITALHNSASHDIKKAQSAVLRRMDDIYRKTVYKATMYMTAGTKSLEQAIDLATKDFLEKGIDCIEYKNGSRVNIASYAEMAIRTASHRAVLLGEGKERDKWGIHTVIVSAHANTCPLCAPWQGKILIDDVFSSGTKEEALKLGYPLLSDAIREGFLHPNCRHTVTTYFEGITQIPEIPDSDKAIETYRYEQQQRAIERQIRKWKRIAEGSIDPEKVNIANDKVEKYQEDLRNHLKEHRELRRNYSREKTRKVPEPGLAKENQEYIEKYNGYRYNKNGNIVVTDDHKYDKSYRILKEYKPFAVVETTENKKGITYVNRTIYDENKRMIKQLHSGNHGNDKEHPYGQNGEHIHDIIWENDKIVSRSTRELTEKERKEHSDIL
ncbi:MAG: phage minor capsid protein [Lachnospiraceae bacterium]